MTTPHPSTTPTATKPQPGPEMPAGPAGPAGPAHPEARFTRSALEAAHAIMAGGVLERVMPDLVGPPGYRAAYLTGDTAPGKARRGVALALRTWGLGQLVDTAELVVSELVTNVVVHTGSRLVGVAVSRLTETTVRMMVLDTDHTDVTVPGPAGPDGDGAGESGRGLFLVASLADRWGVERIATGKRVWCELDAKRVTET